MLRLTKKMDYSIMIMTHLGQNPERSVSASEAANAYNISPALVSNLMKKLSKQGLLESTRGAHGGYQLSRKPSEIRVSDVLRAIEGEFNLATCTSPSEQHRAMCTVANICPSRLPVQFLHDRVNQVLSTTTLEHILAGASPLAMQERP